MTEELIHALSRLPGLQVVSRTSAFEFKDKPPNVKVIGEQLKVGNVVEGSVRKIGDRIRVNTQLVNVSDGVVLWSERFDCNLTDIFDVQDQMARAIADKLKVELGSQVGSALVKRYTENFDSLRSLSARPLPVEQAEWRGLSKGARVFPGSPGA